MWFSVETTRTAVRGVRQINLSSFLFIRHACSLLVSFVSPLSLSLTRSLSLFLARFRALSHLRTECSKQYLISITDRYVLTTNQYQSQAPSQTKSQKMLAQIIAICLLHGCHVGSPVTETCDTGVQCTYAVQRCSVITYQ